MFWIPGPISIQYQVFTGVMSQSEASIVLTVRTVGEGEALVYPQLDQRVQDPRDGRGGQGHGGAVLRRWKKILFSFLKLFEHIL